MPKSIMARSFEDGVASWTRQVVALRVVSCSYVFLATFVASEPPVCSITCRRGSISTKNPKISLFEPFKNKKAAHCNFGPLSTTVTTSITTTRLANQTVLSQRSRCTQGRGPLLLLGSSSG
eukprot:3685277-Rhodomonas_salina.2